MKNRFLRFTFVAFLTGLTSIMMAMPVEGEQGVSVDKSKKMTSSEYFTKIRSNQVTGQIRIGDVIQAREDSKSLSNQKSANGNYNWTALGPNNMGGPTKSIIFDNQDASGNTLYAGSTSGGLWMSTDYGNIWLKVQMDDILNISSIGQASNGTVYIGTGVSLEPAADKIAEGSTIGKGVFKKVGDNVELMPGTAPTGDVDGDWAFIQKLAVDAGGKVYAATNTGLKYYDGENWVYARAGTEDLVGKACDVIIEDGIIVAAVAGNAYVSTGGFSDFVLVSGEEDVNLPIGMFGNIKFAISSANSNYIYASYIDADGALFDVYLSTDKGSTWRVVYPGGSSIGDIYNGQGLRNNSIAVDPTNEKSVYLGAYNLFRGYEAQSTGYYSWEQVTSGNNNPYPTIGSSFYLHFGVNTIVFNPTQDGHVLFGTDGGIGGTKNNFTSVELLNRSYSTSEYFTINASKSGTVFAGAQFNGVHRIEDNGAKQAIEMISGGFGAPSHITGGFSQISFVNPEFYVCSDVSGTFWRSEDAGENTEPILDGDDDDDENNEVTVGEEFISPFFLWESSNNPLSKDSVEFVARKHYNAGDEFFGQSNNYEYPFRSTIHVGMDSADVVMVQDLVSTKAFVAVEGKDASAGFTGGVYMTTGLLDYTAVPNWWQIGAVEGIPTCMAYSKDANYVWVGTLEGRVFRLSNVAHAYDKETGDITSPGCVIAITEIAWAGSQAITSISVDPKDSENVIFTLGNYGNDDYIYASDNGMSDQPTFESIQGNLPTMPLYASSFEVNNDGLVFIGTENGLFYTEDFTASSVDWVFENDGFGNVPVFAIKQQSVNWPSIVYPVNDNFNEYYSGTVNYGALYLGTFGAGAYVTKDFVGFEEFENIVKDENSLHVYPNPAQQLVKVSFDSKTQGNINVDLFDLTGKLVLTSQVYVGVGETTINIDINNLDNGSYIVRMIDGVYKYQSKLVISK